MTKEREATHRTGHGRSIGALIAGYAVIAAVQMVVLTTAYAILGSAGAFAPESFRISPLWGLVLAVCSLFAAALGGAAAGRIDRSGWALSGLMGLMLVLGLLFAVAQWQSPPHPDDLVRLSDVGSTEAMRRARQPMALLFATPLLGAVGVWLGGRWVRAKV